MIRLLSITLVVLAACAGDVAETPDATIDAGATPECTCESPLDTAPVGPNSEIVDAIDFVRALCPEQAEITCTQGVYTDTCVGHVTRYQVIPSMSGCAVRALP